MPWVEGAEVADFCLDLIGLKKCGTAGCWLWVLGILQMSRCLNHLNKGSNLGFIGFNETLILNIKISIFKILISLWSVFPCCQSLKFCIYSDVFKVILSKVKGRCFQSVFRREFHSIFFIMSKCINDFLKGICFKKAFEISHFTF